MASVCLEVLEEVCLVFHFSQELDQPSPDDDLKEALIVGLGTGES